MAQFTIQGSDGQQFGPVDANTLVGWAQEQRLRPTTQVYDHHASKWTEANNLDILKSIWTASINKSSPNSQTPVAQISAVPLTTAFELRPLRLGEILDRTFRLYRQNFVNFFLIALVASIISVILTDTIYASSIYASFGVFGALTGDTAMAMQKTARVNFANLLTALVVIPVNTVLLAAIEFI